MSCHFISKLGELTRDIWWLSENFDTSLCLTILVLLFLSLKVTVEVIT